MSPSTRESPHPPRTLAVVSAPIHYRWHGKLWSYGPYAREIDQWARLFEEVRIVGPTRAEAPPADAVALAGKNVSAEPVMETGGDHPADKLRQLLLLPVLAWQVLLRCRRADAVHVRGPANLCLIAILLAPLIRRPMVAKYAGQWSSYPGERTLVSLQRRLLRAIFPGPVTVYGRAHDDPDHIVDFFTSMMSREQIRAAVEATADGSFHRPLRVLFSGRLYPGKGVLELIDAAAILDAEDIDLDLRIVGDGLLMGEVRDAVADHGLEESVDLLGALPYELALEQFGWADVLVLASRHEGWPKVLTEAMVHHCLCLAPRRGIMGPMVESRGRVLEGIDATAIADGLRDVHEHRPRYQAMLPEAARWASRYSLEDLGEAIGDLLEERWRTHLPGRQRARRPW